MPSLIVHQIRKGEKEFQVLGIDEGESNKNSAIVKDILLKRIDEIQVDSWYTQEDGTKKWRSKEGGRHPFSDWG